MLKKSTKLRKEVNLHKTTKSKEYTSVTYSFGFLDIFYTSISDVGVHRKEYYGQPILAEHYQMGVYWSPVLDMYSNRLNDSIFNSRSLAGIR